MKKGLTFVFFIVMFAVGVYGLVGVDSTPQPIVAEAVSVKMQNLYNSVVAQGKVIGNRRQSIIFSEPSNILDVYVREGQNVKKGDRILLRKTSRSDNTLRAFVTSIQTMLSDYGIDASNLVTVSENTALVTSTINGVVSNVTIEKGESVLPFVTAVEICDKNTCTVIAEIPELYISSIQIGQHAVVNGSAFEKDEYRGIVTKISEKAQKKINLTGEGSNYFPVEISLSSCDSSLRSGCSATIKIKTAEKKDALVIPYECITQQKDNREVVGVLKEDGSVEFRRIITGLELDDETEIIYGLKHGEQVIRNPEDYCLTKEKSE